MDSAFKDKLQNLKSHLIMIKSLKESEAQDQYFNLLEKAKQTLGQVSPHIASFYFQYGNFLLNKIQKGMDILNAGAVPEAQANEDIDQIPEVYEDQDELYGVGANSQKGQKNQEKVEKVVFEDDNVQITENEKLKIGQNGQQTPKKIVQGEQNPQKQEEEKQEDIEIAYEHFQVALNILQKQRQKINEGEQSPLPKQQIEKNMINIHSRLGDLYMLDEQYTSAIEEYNAVIKIFQERQDSGHNRIVSEAHYMIGNCYLHDNKQNCQKLAIREYIKSVRILIRHIQVLQNYDVSRFEIPTEQKIRVDRYAYLNYPMDSQTVKDIKQVVGILLDKIQDTYEQIGQRGIYEREKNKMNKEKQEVTFKEVSKDVKVTSLGTFGNRKRNPTTQENSNPNSQKKQNVDKTQTQIKVKELINPKSQEKPKNNTNNEQLEI